jgi:methionine aminopeptidase
MSVTMRVRHASDRRRHPVTLWAVSIETPEELEGLRASGRIVAETLRAMRRAVRPGVTTGELDAIAARIFRRAGARSAPQLTYGFPVCTADGALCAHEEHTIVITRGAPLVLTA